MLNWACPLCHGFLEHVVGQRSGELSGQNEKDIQTTFSGSTQSPISHHQTYICSPCQTSYAVRKTYLQQTQPDFRPATQAGSLMMDEIEQWQNRLKLFLRQWPAFYRFLVITISPVLILGPSSQTFVKGLGPDAKVLSIGAGVMRLKGQVTHLDYEPYPHLEVVGDANHLPFSSDTFDGVVCESVLEHVLEPERVIAEMHRVLKPGGKIYIMIPFIYGFHAAPNDFSRLTHRGLQTRMAAFDQDLLKVVSGPMSALNCILMEWLAIVFSLGSRRLYQVFSLGFMVLLAPLKILDFILCHHPEAARIASLLVFIGRKK